MNRPERSSVRQLLASSRTIAAILETCAACVFGGLFASAPPRPPAAFTLENIAPAAGLNFRQVNYATEMKYPFETLGGAVAALDYNNDGLVDLFF